MPQYDFLVIGSGIAGLTYALKTARHFPDKKVAIITKSDESESNTKYAQGGIAVVTNKVIDSYQQHIEDTIKAGDGLCDPEIVEMVVREAPERLNELIEWNVEFDKQQSDQYKLGREGGHSQNRILHHKDITGYEIERKLLHQVHHTPNIDVYEQHFAVDLVTEHHLGDHQNPDDLRCYGAYVLDAVTEKVELFAAKITVLATGGIGQVYQNTTNPYIATGDGIGMAYRAKARISHMEFIQFHPTALYVPEQTGTSFLISEAVRGFGAILRNKRGEAFMYKYDERKELASRDIVSRAIDTELKKSGDECVFLDCTHLDQEAFGKNFPNIKTRCTELGIDLSKDMIPVVPASHYLCGGVVVNEYGQTTIQNLYACGECACTGLHGANRLASNSLLEALIFSHKSYLKSVEMIEGVSYLPSIPPWDEEGTTKPEELILITHNRRELQVLMNDYVAIVRSDERLKRASNRIGVLYDETEELYKRTQVSPQLLELRNLIITAYLIVKQSMDREENRGAFFKIPAK